MSKAHPKSQSFASEQMKNGKSVDRRNKREGKKGVKKGVKKRSEKKKKKNAKNSQPDSRLAGKILPIYPV